MQSVRCTKILIKGVASRGEAKNSFKLLLQAIRERLQLLSKRQVPEFVKQFSPKVEGESSSNYKGNSGNAE